MLIAPLPLAVQLLAIATTNTLLADAALLLTAVALDDLDELLDATEDDELLGATDDTLLDATKLDDLDELLLEDELRLEDALLITTELDDLEELLDDTLELLDVTALEDLDELLLDAKDEELLSDELTLEERELLDNELLTTELDVLAELLLCTDDVALLAELALLLATAIIELALLAADELGAELEPITLAELELTGVEIELLLDIALLATELDELLALLG